MGLGMATRWHDIERFVLIVGQTERQTVYACTRSASQNNNPKHVDCHHLGRIMRMVFLDTVGRAVIPRNDILSCCATPFAVHQHLFAI